MLHTCLLVSFDHFLIKKNILNVVLKIIICPFHRERKLKLRKFKSPTMPKFESRTILNSEQERSRRRLRHDIIQCPHFADKETS